jgi:hypothetical protein
MIHGAVPNEADQINVWRWNGHCTAPVAVTLRDKNNYSTRHIPLPVGQANSYSGHPSTMSRAE